MTMMLPKLSTTVVGSYSVPRWYEALEKQVEAGTLSWEDMRDAQFRATEAAILDHEVAGIDVLTGGEMHRRTNNRHAPPNAMLNFFWNRIPGFSEETRPKPITPQDEHVTHPAAVCDGPIGYGDLGLVDEYKNVSSLTRHGSVKVTMTGPHMLAKVAWDEHYGDLSRMMQDLAKVMHENFKELERSGCRFVQIDEPLFAMVERAEVAAAVEAINMALEGIRMSRMMHVCQGNYAVGEHYDGQIGHRYFTGRYPADLIAKADVDVLLIEHDMADAYEGLLGDKQLGVGAVDVQDRKVENADTIVERIAKHRWLPLEQTLITSSCGMNHLSRDIAFGKLMVMSEAKRRLERSAGADVARAR